MSLYGHENPPAEWHRRLIRPLALSGPPCVFCWARHKRHMNITFGNLDGKSARWAWISVSKVCSANSAEQRGKTDEDASRHLRRVRTMDDRDLWASPYRPPSDKQAEICHTHSTSDPRTASSCTEWTQNLQGDLQTFYSTRLTLWCFVTPARRFLSFPTTSFPLLLIYAYKKQPPDKPIDLEGQAKKKTGQQMLSKTDGRYQTHKSVEDTVRRADVYTHLKAKRHLFVGWRSSFL